MSSDHSTNQSSVYSSDMPPIGMIDNAIVQEVLPTGYWLLFDEEHKIFLPIEYCELPLATQDSVRVLITTNQEGECVADAKVPSTPLNEGILLTAKDATDRGAFFDWGASRDLYIPTKWQESPINPGMDYVVVPFYDEKSQRIVGCTKLKHFYQETNEWLKPQQSVALQVFAITQLGYKMLIDNTTLGLLFNTDVHVTLRIGEKIQGTIKTIREDGKINVAIGPQTKQARLSLNDAILEDLKAHDGLSTLTDKSSPEEIYERFKVSKGAYKKALGNLFKSKKIIIDKTVIRLS